MYKTQIQYTFEEYKKFNKAIFKTLLIKRILILFFIVLAIGIIPLILFKSIAYLIGAVLGFIIGIFLMILINKYNIKRTWKSNASMRDTINDITFNETQLEVNSKNGNMTIKYKDIYKIIETDTNFYIMIANNQGVIINKNNCDNELIDFIKKLK